ncbi:MAG: multidrug ABC transporter permease [Alphaproteobacteria bacterium]|nr:multidrug ABC transporter permease [Alphaproteobacteria bacterium]
MKTNNWIGLATIYKRESWRFLKVWNQTLIAPMITTLIFLAVLTLALGGAERTIDGMPYAEFIAPGLIMMAIVQNAFANTSSSLMIAKLQGVIVDWLMPPISGFEWTAGMALGGITRGVMVGVTVSLAMACFVPLGVHSLPALIYFAVASSAMLALFGVLAGVWGQTPDQVAAVTNFVVTPLSFLSGTFYSIHSLPVFWQHVSHANPFFYMIDGFRYAMTGYSDSDPMLGAAVLLATNLVLFVVVQTMFARGYRLKS